MKKIFWNPFKSKQIEGNPNRNVSLETLAGIIQQKGYLDVIQRAGYPDQKAYVVPLGDQVWCVPAREEDKQIILITAWPDRTLKKRYLKGDS